MMSPYYLAYLAGIAAKSLKSFSPSHFGTQLSVTEVHENTCVSSYCITIYVMMSSYCIIMYVMMSSYCIIMYVMMSSYCIIMYVMMSSYCMVMCVMMSSYCMVMEKTTEDLSNQQQPSYHMPTHNHPCTCILNSAALLGEEISILTIWSTYVYILPFEGANVVLVNTS